jgi:PKD repeat protein
MKLCGFLLMGFILLGSRVNGQCPVSDFSVLPTACINQSIQLKNEADTGAYRWDFCSDDFNIAPTANLSYSLSAANGRPDIAFIYDGSKWFGFVTGTYSNVLYRLEFLNGTHQPPTLVQNLGNVSNKLNGPGQVKIFREGNDWFGLVHNTTNGELLKLSFGDKLSNPISVSTLATGLGYINSGMAVARDVNQGWICILSQPGNNFIILRLGNAISVPGASDIIQTSEVPNPNSLSSIDLINVCGMWYAFATNLGNGNIYRLDFGASLFSTPAITQIVTLPVINPGTLRVVREGEDYFLFVVTLEGTLIKVEIGSDITANPDFTSEGNIDDALPANLFGLGITKNDSRWTIAAISLANGQVYNINYQQNCSANTLTSLEANPQVKYAVAGNYSIALEVSTPQGTSVRVKNVQVVGLVAPDISILTDGACAQRLVDFTSQSVGSITGYSWNFGDGQISSVAEPVHTYSSAGQFEVALEVTAANGCLNRTSELIRIYNKPVADFNLPVSNPICSNQEYTFTNTSSYDVGSNPVWHWIVNSTHASNLQNLVTTFNTNANREIILQASIPGCVSEKVINLSNIQTGPVLDFAVTNGCQLEGISITNSTTSPVLGFSWAFGDGESSIESNPTHTYNNFGVYDVTLTANNAAGCSNSLTKSITIYSKPTANFSLALPPFSCSGSASQFTDLTPSPTDSNITLWNWTFGDTQNNVAAINNPSHMYATAGDYSVSLNVVTNFGCTSEITKTVTIAQTPNVDFTNTALCLNQPATFTPTATTEIKAWLWGMQNLTYTAQSPVHAFTTSGNQTVTMAATGNNNCVKSVTKNLSVPVPVTINFSANSTCAGKPAEFTETSLTGLDPAVSWSWDFAGQASATTSSATHIFPATGNFNVRLNSTRQSGCTYSSTRSIAISQAPVSQFSVSTESGGAPLAVGFVNTSSGATSWLWNFNDADQTTSTEFSPAFTYNQLGTYQAELIARNNLGCTDSFTKTIFVVEPQINVAVTNLLLIANNDGALATVTFENRSNVVVVNPEIILDLAGKAKIKERVFGTFLPGQQSSKSISTRIVSDNLGYICAEISVAGDVNSFDNRACSNLTGELTVVPPYPNPASEEVILEWIRGQRNQVEVKLYNVQGQVVLNKVHTNLSAGLNQLLIKVDALLPGLYFATVSDGDNTASYRVQVNR